MKLSLTQSTYVTISNMNLYTKVSIADPEITLNQQRTVPLEIIFSKNAWSSKAEVHLLIIMSYLRSTF
jgi:hypothetical protein